MNRTRLFAMPLRSDQFYEFNAMSISSSSEPAVAEIETDIADWKYIKRMRKARVLLKLGVMFPDGMRMVAHGFVENQRRNVLGCTCLFEFKVTSPLEQVE